MNERHSHEDPEEYQDESNEEHTEGHLIDETVQSDEGKRRRYRKIKIRKRVRIKRKKSPKKKAKKLIETIAWVVIVAAFLITLLIMVLQLDLTTRTKKRNISYKFPIEQNFNRQITSRLCPFNTLSITSNRHQVLVNHF